MYTYLRSRQRGARASPFNVLWARDASSPFNVFNVSRLNARNKSRNGEGLGPRLPVPGTMIDHGARRLSPTFDPMLMSGFILAFVVSTTVYGIITVLVIAWLERRRSSSGCSHWRVKFAAMDRTVDIINFANALITSALSSWVLQSLDGYEAFNVIGGRPSGVVADWTLGSVCGYIVVESLLLYVTSHRLRGDPWSWSLMKDAYKEMVLFHMVALVGLTSVVIRNTGYPLALWVVWSELTSVFLGLERFIEVGRYLCSRSVHTWLVFAVRACSAVLFVLQRVVVFYFLLWLSWRHFVWEVGFLFQLTILIAGTSLNTHMGFTYIKGLLSDS